MAQRRLGADDGTALFACSICGVPSRFPSEMKYTAERKFQCFRHADTTTNLEEARKHGQGLGKTNETTPQFPLGVLASWQVT